MAIQQVSPPMGSPSPHEGNARKRVCKACDRCRLKKSKCDGSNPCSRCRADNAICVFGDRKKSHDKVYPKGYVEMLENQQAQLVQGLQELYRRAQTREGWIGSPLKETSQGVPLTHDILERLGALKQDGDNDTRFEEDLNAIRHRLIANGAGLMQRDTSPDGDSDVAQSPMFDQFPQKATGFGEPFALNSFPPTPPSQSPYPRSINTVPSKFATYPRLNIDQLGSDPALHPHQTWNSTAAGLDDTVDFLAEVEPPSFDAFTPMFSQIPPLGTIHPAMSMKSMETDYINPSYI